MLNLLLRTSYSIQFNNNPISKYTPPLRIQIAALSTLANFLRSTELKKNCSSDLIIYIVGSKADLHHLRQVTSDRVRLSLARWFPPPQPPPPPTPPQQPSTLSYIRPRFTSFTTSRSVPVNQLAPKALDDNAISRPSELRRAISAVPRTRQEGAHGLRRANSQNGTATSPQRSKLFERPFQPASRFGGSLFGVHSGGYVDTVDESSNSVPEEDEDDDSDTTEWGLEKGMSLFEVSAKDDFGELSVFPMLFCRRLLILALSKFDRSQAAVRRLNLCDHRAKGRHRKRKRDEEARFRHALTYTDTLMDCSG
jgi:hypothetical protein